MIIYEVECYEKKSDKYVKSISLPNNGDKFYRNFLNIEDNNLPMYGIEITPEIQKKFKMELNIDIDINKYYCIFAELSQ